MSELRLHLADGEDEEETEAEGLRNAPQGLTVSRRQNVQL